MRRNRSRVVPLVLCLTTLIPAARAQQPEVTTLDPGRPVEREMKAGETHAYRLRLEANRYVKVVVEQKGLDVAVALFAPDGAKVVDVDGPNGTDGPETLAAIASAAGEYRLEIRLLEPGPAGSSYAARLVETRPATDGDRPLVEAVDLSGRSALLANDGRSKDALPLAERALALYEKGLAADDPGLAEPLLALANRCRETGGFDKAEPLYVRAVALLERRFGADSLPVANALTYQSALYQETSRLEPAIELNKRALATFERVYGPDHPRVAGQLNNLASDYEDQGRYADATPLYERSIAIFEKALGPDHINVAILLNNLALNYDYRGVAKNAEALYERSLAIREKLKGPDDPDITSALNNLAEVYRNRGDFAKAEPLYARAFAIREKALGPDAPDTATSEVNLALNYRDQGSYDKAEPLMLRALAAREKSLGPEAPLVANSLTNIAMMYEAQGFYTRAEPLLVRALAIREKALGPDHANVANTLNNLALVYRDEGENAKAEPLYVRALAIWEKAFGPEHVSVATGLSNLATTYREMGMYDKAEPLYERAIAIREKLLGPDNPSVGDSLNNLAIQKLATGDVARALALQARANDMRERQLSRNLVAGSERAKLQYLRLTGVELDRTLSMVVRAPDDPAARRAGLEIVLRRKGRALDAMTDAVDRLRRAAGPEDRALLDELAAARSELATATLRGPGGEGPERYRTNLEALADRVDALEDRTARQSIRFRAELTPVTLDAVRRAVPADAALVEIAAYRPFDARATHDKQFGAPRYVAFVLAATGDPRWVDLGETAPIDAAVHRLRSALRDPKRTDARQLGRALDELVMRPVRALLGPQRTLLVSPDGALNLVPFGALVDEQDRYLVERYTIVNLTSGRDLLRLGERADARQEAMVVADPAYGVAGAAGAASRKIGLPQLRPGDPSVDFADVTFPPLRFTEGEARSLGRLLPGSRVLTREQATERALKNAAGPGVMHVATHGYFLPDLAVGAAGAERVENPLLRSGLALAGANARKSGDDDGVLTAMEVAGLDLWGTKLVVLSACDTGVGEVRTGEGVYGLRRALVLAGSESQVMSLWAVSDRGTRDLMVAYYRGLTRGEGRAEALRRVQLRMLGDPATRHPFYWAGFIQSGAWGPLGR